MTTMTTFNAGNRFHALFLESKHHIQKSRANFVWYRHNDDVQKPRPARVGTCMARAHICEHQLLLSNFTNEPKFPSTSHDKKTHPSGSKTFANVRYISKFDTHICRSQFARKTPVGCQEGTRYHPRAGNLVSMPHSSPIIFPTGMWPCIGMIVSTKLGSVHIKTIDPFNFRQLVSPINSWDL